ncbi:MAG: efflux RND transporter periplasmic adaptor subunit [Oscillospiraceae bacterium]|nr:efflux RND transporter periplasmic adaptor subunit [Oscillospiraceae bacterium]
MLGAVGRIGTCVALAAAIAAAAALSGCAIFDDEPEALESVDIPSVPRYVTALVETADYVKTINLMAKARFKDVYNLSFTREDVLTEIYVSLYDEVEKGQLLAEIETGDLDYEHANAVRRYEDSLAAYGKRLQECRERIANERKALAKLKDDLEALLGDPIKPAQSRVDDLERRIADQEEHIEYRLLFDGDDGFTMQIEAISLDNALDDLRAVEKRIDGCKIISPVDGVVTFKNIEAVTGKKVAAYAKVLEVAVPEGLYLTSEMDPDRRLLAGYECQIVWHSQSMERHEFTGWVAQVEREIRRRYEAFKYGGSGSNKLFIYSDEFPEGMRHGDNVSVTIVIEQRLDVLVVPASAVTSLRDRATVDILVDGIRRKVDVEVGEMIGFSREIMKGLNLGDEVFI